MGTSRIESRAAAVDQLTRDDVVELAGRVSQRWLASTPQPPTLIDIDVLVSQLTDALHTAYEQRECDRRRELLRRRMLRLLGDD
jgi:hypothetical protein